MIRTTRTTAAALAALALTATLGACGGSGSDGEGKADDKPREEKAAERQPAGPASKAELGKQVLVKKDLSKSLRKSFDYILEADPKKGRDVVTPSRCQPLADPLTSQQDKKSAAFVRHKVMTSRALDGADITLVSYEDAAAAEAALKAVGASAKACKSGFKTVNKTADYEDRYTRVTPRTGTSGGDASLAFDVKGEGTEDVGANYTFDLILVRTGSTLATFSRYNDPKLAADTGRKKAGDNGKVPAELVTAQLDKIKAAQKN